MQFLVDNKNSTTQICVIYVIIGSKCLSFNFIVIALMWRAVIKHILLNNLFS